MSVDTLCAEISSIYNQESDHKVQSERLRQLLQGVFVSHGSNFADLTGVLKRLVETVINNESTSMVVSRQFIADITTQLQQPGRHAVAVKSVADCLLNLLQTRAIAYEEQSTQIRLLLASIFERERAFNEAARTLIGIPLETSQRNYHQEFKMGTYLRIAELCLEGGNVDEAETQVNRASLLQNDVKDQPLLIKYKAIYAQCLDRRGRFIEAAQRYHELSLKPGLVPSEKRQVLQNSLTCTLLAPPGFQRNRLLTTLFKDERCQPLLGYSILKNMYLERLIKNAELTEFESTLSPHQRIVDDDGASILQRSVIEHNMLATSKLYANITFDGLGELLGITAVKAEKVATQMISTERLKGALDQLEKTVSFEGSERSLTSTNEWDTQIVSICELVNSIDERIAATYPDWHAQKFKDYANLANTSPQQSHNGVPGDAQPAAVPIASSSNP